MLKKYLNFLKLTDEMVVFEAILEHSRHDDDELGYLVSMIEVCQIDSYDKIEELKEKITAINNKSHKEFEMLSDQIVNSNHDSQKQHDILRIHNRVELISGSILATSKLFDMATKIQCSIPKTLVEDIQNLGKLVKNMHRSYIEVVKLYLKRSNHIMDAIHTVQDEENYIDYVRTECLTKLYALANNEPIKMGSFMLLQQIIEGLEEISDEIDAAALAFNMLLIANR